LAAAANTAVRAVPGVELSVDCSSGVMHMLGYWMDVANPELVRRWRDPRWPRDAQPNHAGKAHALGFAMTWDEVQGFAGEDVVGRPHFAQVMLQKGYAKDKNEAFDKWLGDGKPGYADRPRLTAETAVALIRQAGGVAVLAHPFSLRIGKDAMASLSSNWPPPASPAWSATIPSIRPI
jgi:predicted metal-dependent phosphoesterase TrpH